MSPHHAADSVIVLGNHAPGCVAGTRSLGRRGIPSTIASEDSTIPAFSSQYCTEKVVMPNPFDDLSNYSDTLLGLAKRPDVRTIMPFREPDVYTLSKHRAEFAEHVATLWPEFATLRRAQDRVELVEAALDADVPVPRTQLLDDVDDWDRELIVKARYSILCDEYDTDLSSDRVIEMGKTRYLRSGREPDRDSLREAMSHTPIVQEYVPGTEYTFRALYDHGEPVITSQKRLVRGQKYPRGPSVYHESVSIPELEEAGRALLDHLAWHGVASVGFMEDRRTGAFKLLEINPRFWASLPLDIHAGLDYPYYYWRLAGGEPVTGYPEADTGTASHYLFGELSHLNSVLREDYPLVERPSPLTTVTDIVSSTLEQPNFDLLSADDPRPFLRGGWNALREHVRVGSVMPSMMSQPDTNQSEETPGTPRNGSRVSGVDIGGQD